MRERIRTAFFQSGWLLPVLLPLTQVGGRALANVLMLVYLIWALLAVPGSRVRVERAPLLLFVALLLAYLLSVPGAVAAQSALHEWVKFVLHALVFYFMLVVLQQRPDAMRRLIEALGIVGLALLALLLLKLAVNMQAPGFLVTADMKEDNLPFLLPFSLYYLLALRAPRWRVGFSAVLLSVALGYIVMSQGRAALAGLLAALLVYGVFVLRWRRTAVALAGLAVLAVAVGLSYETFFRQAGGGDWVAWLDRFTSLRSQLWRQALAHPPANALLGVGMANVGQYAEVVTVENGARLGHLHNFLFDAWYETGLLGLGALLIFIAVPLARGWRLARAGGETGAWAGLFLASATALLVAGLLSFSYASRQFAVYLPIQFAALWVLSQFNVPATREPAG